MQEIEEREWDEGIEESRFRYNPETMQIEDPYREIEREFWAMVRIND